MIASPAYADWVKVAEVENGTFYVDSDRIRKNDGYVYFWRLIDLLEPDEDGDLSYVGYAQGDCEMFRLKALSVISYKQPMGEGSIGETNSKSEKDWSYPPPNTIAEIILKQVCEVAEYL